MAAGGQLHLPTATFEELCALPGVGPALARRILDYRLCQPLAAVDDLAAVPGMTAALLARLRGHLSVEGPDCVPPGESPPAPEAESPPEGGTSGAAPAPSEAGPGERPTAFSADENWPRSYGGVNPAVLFGEAETALVTDSPAPDEAATPLDRGRAALLVGSGALLGTLLTLSLLYTLNQGLYYVPRQEWERAVVQPLATMEAETAALGARVEHLEAATTAFESSLAATDRRVQALEDASTQVEELQASLGTIQSDVEAVQTRADQFGSFLEGVRSALEDLVP